MGKWIWKYILLLLALTKVSELNAADIRSAQDLKNALGNEASIEGNVVTLNNNKTITQTLNILGGTMTLVIPEGITLTGDFSSYSGDAITVNVNGGNLSVDGGGTVTSIAAKGAKGADNTVGSGGKGQQGHSARTIIYENGILSLKKITILGIPGEGGDGGSGWFGASTGPKGDPGETWVLDPEDQKRVKDAIAPGYYIKGASNENYESAGYQTAEVIVDKITYQVSYGFNGGQKETDGTNTYTVDTKDFILPTAVKKGYSLVWLYNTDTVDVNNLPIPTDTWGETVGVDFVAKWTRIVYKITYDTKGGTLKDAVESYTVDTAFTLPAPTRENYEFAGWYDEKGEKKDAPILKLGLKEPLKNYYDQVIVSFDDEIVGDAASEKGVSLEVLEELVADKEDTDALSVEGVKIYLARSDAKDTFTNPVDISDCVYIDNKAPVADIKDYTPTAYSKMVNALSFGMFTDKVYTAKIEIAEDGSGLSGTESQTYHVYKLGTLDREIDIADRELSKDKIGELIDKIDQGTDEDGWIKIPDNKEIPVGKANSKEELENNYLIFIRTIDNAGNCAVYVSNGIVIDQTPPTLNVNFEKGR